MRTLSSGEAELIVALREGMFERPLRNGFLEMLRKASGASYAAPFFARLTDDLEAPLHSRSGSAGAA